MGPETLVDVVLEGCEALALADSGSQVNTVTLEFVQELGYPVLPLSGLVNYPLHLVGLGGRRTCPLGFVIARLQVKEVAGYDEDVVFLVVPDGSNFGKQVPIVIVTCTLVRVINVIKVCLAQLLSRRVMKDETPSEVEAGADEPEKKGMDTVIELGSNTHVGPFQTKILEGKISQAPACDTHVMITPLGRVELKQGGGCQLPPGLHVLHTYTTMVAGCKQISLVVQNMTDQAIFLKKGTPVAHVVSATLAPSEETPTEDENAHAPKERMTVQERQDKLLEKLNLDGLSEWTPRNAAIARELLLSYHDAFTLEHDELGCTSAIEHEICLSDEEPFKEQFRRIPPPLLDEVRASLRDILEAGAIRPSQSPWCNAVVLVRKKDGSLWFCVDF